MIRVAIVDRYVSEEWYSCMLTKALSRYCNVFYYGNEGRGLVRKVWTPQYLFPFQITKQAIKDSVDIVHYQFELNKFGSTGSNLFIPLMLLLLRFARKKVVVTVHGVIPIRMFRSSEYDIILPTNVPRIPAFLKMAMYFLYGSFSKLGQKIVVHAKIFRKWLLEYKLNPDKIVVIPHGIEERTSAIFCHNPKIVLTFGVLTPRKGIETLIRAFEKLGKKSVLLVIIGREMPYYRGYKESLQRLAEEKELENVLFFGHVSDSRAHSAISWSDVVVFPYRVSISASGALAWAIGHKKPVIVSDTEFFREELSSEEAMFFPINNSDILAKEIAEVLSDVQLRESLSHALEKKTKSQSWDVIAKKTLEVYG